MVWTQVGLSYSTYLYPKVSLEYTTGFTVVIQQGQLLNTQTSVHASTTIGSMCRQSLYSVLDSTSPGQLQSSVARRFGISSTAVAGSMVFTTPQPATGQTCIVPTSLYTYLCITGCHLLGLPELLIRQIVELAKTVTIYSIVSCRNWYHTLECIQ